MTSRWRRLFLATLALGVALAMVAIVLPPAAGDPLRSGDSRANGSPGSSGSRPSAPATAPAPGATISADVVVYGATPSGIMAAVRAARAGASVVLVTPERQVGGMMTSGISHPDVRRKDLVGGLTRSVFDRLRVAERREPGASTVGWSYEPHVAARVFGALLHEAHVVLYLNKHLDRTQPPELEGDRIAALRMTDGTRLAGRVFIDATYEGDLMAAAGVPFSVGRESIAAYGESLAGVDVDEPISPSSTLVLGLDGQGRPLPGVDVATIEPGSSDALVQAATYRLCVSSDPANQLPFVRPDSYDPTAYELIGRAIAKVRERTRAVPPLASILTLARLPDRKADLNNYGLFSTDLVGGASGWANADDVGRQAIRDAHRAWVAGLLWYLETDPRVPARLHRQLAKWGLCADEFVATGGWPTELYIREARRLVGSIVLTQHDLRDHVSKPDPIALGTYRIDAHYVRRVLGADNLVRGDGQLSAATLPYQIPYAAIVPPPGSVDNLLVSVTVSASHVAWASIRTEPTLMQIGEAAGVAAAVAVRDGVGVREVDYNAIRTILLAGHGILSVPPVGKHPAFARLSLPA